MEKLPVKRIVFYKHGVGYLERRGKVKENEVGLEFKKENMNDILKSLLVIDKSGKVIGVNYDSHEDIGKKLKTALVVQESDAIMGLLRTLKGNEVSIISDNEVKGKIVGIGTKKVEENVGTLSVSLLDEKGVVHFIDIDKIKTIRLVDESNRKDLQYSLELAAAEKKSNIKTASVSLSGEDEHDLRVSYITELPVWRVSYRFAFDGDGAFIQGWGIVDNPLDEDLDDISVSLVAGKPVSFEYDFYAPPISHRPRVKEYAHAVSQPIEMEVPMKKMMLRRAESKVAPMMAEYRSREGEVEFESAEALEEIDLEAEVKTLGKEIGALFRYDITDPVTIKRGQSAMLPILQHSIECEKVNVFNRSNNSKHPSVAIRFKNKTGLVLERGPATIYEKNTYAGEAILPFTPDGSEQFLVYATELGVEVNVSSTTSTKFIESTLRKWYFVRTMLNEKRTKYEINNKTNKPMKIIIEHPKQNELVKTTKPNEETTTHYRWIVNIPADRSIPFDVFEEKRIRYEEKIVNLTTETLENYFKSGEISKELKEKLQEIIERYQKIEEIKKEKENLEAESERINKEQSRLRDNIASISGKADDLTKRYISQLEKQEDRIQEINTRISEIENEILSIEKEIKNIVNSF